MSANRPATFLLSQLGALASARFADKLQSRGLTPSQAGVLRLLGRNGGISQRALAERLGTVPSRVVVLVDALESRGLVVRTRGAQDRRHQELALTDAGQEELRRIRPAVEEHEREFLVGLSDEERSRLAELLGKLARSWSLDPEVHPGYRTHSDGSATPSADA